MIRALQIAANTLTSVFLAAVVGFVLMEKTWVGKEPDTPEGHFLYGSTKPETGSISSVSSEARRESMKDFLWG